jgi:hypothetical protein
MTAINEAVQWYILIWIEEILLIKDAPLCPYVHGPDRAAWNHMIRRHNARRDRCFNRAIGIDAMILSHTREVKFFLADRLDERTRSRPPIRVSSACDHLWDIHDAFIHGTKVWFNFIISGYPAVYC